MRNRRRRGRRSDFSTRDTRERGSSGPGATGDDSTGVKGVRPVGRSQDQSGTVFDIETVDPAWTAAGDSPTESQGLRNKDLPVESSNEPRHAEPAKTQKTNSSRPADAQLDKWVAFDLGEDDIPLPAHVGKPLDAKLVAPRVETSGSKTWLHDGDRRLVAHGLLCPKIVGQCEDSPPVFFAPAPGTTGTTYLGVFDGMGGAGAGQVTFTLRSQDNRSSISSTEALLASRICRRAAVRLITTSETLRLTDLKSEIESRLESAKNRTSLREGSRIRGTLTKRLPTTLVLSQVQPVASGNRSRIITWWAGDSRAFLITPEHGLAVLTRDHVREVDQLDQLRSDPPIENVVNQSTDFYLDETIQEVSGPFVLLLATDGVFGYLPTPGILELGLLEALSCGSHSATKQFSQFCTSYAADDVSAVMIVAGFQDDDEVANQFLNRLSALRERYSQILTMTPDDPDWMSEVERLWSLERPAYQRLLGALNG